MLKQYKKKVDCYSVRNLALDTGTSERTVKRWLVDNRAPLFLVLYWSKKSRGGHQYIACTTVKWMKKYRTEHGITAEGP